MEQQIEELEIKIKNHQALEDNKEHYSQCKRSFNSDAIWKLKRYLDDNHKVYCKCGHSVIICPPITKKICNWCGHYVFKTKKDEFLYRYKEASRKKI